MSIIERDLIKLITDEVIQELNKDANAHFKRRLPVAISGRHVHLAKDDFEALFGKGYGLTKHKNLSQTGQFASREKVTIEVNNNRIENVRVLGPFREETQIEITISDARRLGVEPIVRDSGKLKGSPSIKLIGPRGEIILPYGCIVAKRHIHMSPQDASLFGVRNNQNVSVRFYGERGGIMDNVVVKINDTYKLEMHIDADEANAFNVKSNDIVEVIK